MTNHPGPDTRSARESRFVLALIPAYNEAARLGRVVHEAREHLPVLVVDDGSKDATAEVAAEAGADVHRQVPNAGKGAALRAGFRIALERGYAAVLTLDADGQHAPAEIPRFLEALDGGADLAIGARDFSRMPLIRRISNVFARWTFSRVVGQRIEDNQSGFRLLRAPLLERLLESEEQGFEFEVEMIVVCVRDGFRLAWVPISTIYAGETSHVRPWAHTRNYLRVLRKAKTMMGERSARSGGGTGVP